METQIRFDFELPQTPAQVWAALTDSASLRDWLMPNDFEPTLGHRFRFWSSADQTIRCQIADLLEDVLLAYWWDDGESDEPSLVTWRLTPTDGGTRVQMAHTHFDSLPVTTLENAQNWRSALSRFVPVVFMSEEEEQNPNRRLAGLRDRNQEVTA
ncbi:MAG: SRPBCC family protein [Fimbriimonas sp.]